MPHFEAVPLGAVRVGNKDHENLVKKPKLVGPFVDLGNHK